MNVFILIKVPVVFFVFSILCTFVLFFRFSTARPFGSHIKDYLWHNYSLGANITARLNDQAIIFPDSLESLEHSAETTTPRLISLDAVPECAKEDGFCEDIPSYPREVVQRVLSQISTPEAFFQQDPLPEIVQRIGESSEDEERFICRSVDKIIYPKVGRTENHKWKYIINDDVKSVQAIRVETCSSLNKPCDLLGSEANGYITKCKQKFAYRRLLSLSDEGQAVQETFLMPSACCCSYKRDVRFLTRFGKPPQRSRDNF